MSYFIRKVDKPSWNKTDITTGDISSDAVTNCLKTTLESLSLWKVDSNDQETVNKIIVAIATNFTALESFDIVVIDEKDLHGEFEIVQTQAPTSYDAMATHHYDFVKLKLSTLSSLADSIYSYFKSGSFIRISKSQIRALMKEYVEKKEINIEKLHSNVAKHC